MSKAGNALRVRETAAQLDQRNQLARLRAELEVERLRFDVALAVVGSISDVVPDHADQRHVVDEVIRRWNALAPQEQTKYRLAASSFGALTHFAWETIETVGREPFAEFGEDEPPSEFESERIHCEHWRRFVEQLRREASERA